MSLPDASPQATEHWDKIRAQIQSSEEDRAAYVDAKRAEEQETLRRLESIRRDIDENSVPYSWG